MLKISDLLLSPGVSLRTALQRMTQNRKKVIYLCKSDGQLVGVLSQKDIQRALLEQVALSKPIGELMDTAPPAALSVKEAQSLMRQSGFGAVPVIDERRCVTQMVVMVNGRTETLSYATAPTGNVVNGERSLQAVAIIPARGGSKRVPRKNLVEIGGKPLIAWAIEIAQAAHHVGSIIVSTDDEEIADVAQHYGAEVPWLRPAELAHDETQIIDVIAHVSERMPALPAQTLAVLLEPTSPLRTTDHVDTALELLVNSDADSVVSVSEVPHPFNPEWLLVIDEDELRPYLPQQTMNTRKPRGHQKPVYVQNGQVYAFYLRQAHEQHDMYGRVSLPLVTPWEYYLDIDFPEDIAIADLRIRQLLSHLT